MAFVAAATAMDLSMAHRSGLPRRTWMTVLMVMVGARRRTPDELAGQREREKEDN